MDFEADNEIDNSNMGNSTTKIYRQNPTLNGYDIISDLDDVLKNSYYKFPLGYDRVNWLVDESKILENKKNFYLKNIKKIS